MNTTLIDDQEVILKKISDESNKPSNYDNDTVELTSMNTMVSLGEYLILYWRSFAWYWLNELDKNIISISL